MPQTIVTNWDSAYVRLHNKAAMKLQSRKVANNTYLVHLDNNDIAVRLHDTNIIVYHYDGTITLDSGGWHTRVTKDRMNAFLPSHIRVFQEDYDWFVWYRWQGVTVPFYDGITFDPKQEAS